MLLTIRSETETLIKILRFTLILLHEVGNLPAMARRALTPLLGLCTTLWFAGVHTGAASPNPPSSSFDVAAVSLGGDNAAPIAPPEKSKLSVAGVFQPAPMPDPDAEAPAGGGASGPSLTPALFSHKEEFAGDGFAAASDADHGLDHRRAPAAGLNWSVPVK